MNLQTKQEIEFYLTKEITKAFRLTKTQLAVTQNLNDGILDSLGLLQLAKIIEPLINKNNPASINIESLLSKEVLSIKYLAQVLSE